MSLVDHPAFLRTVLRIDAATCVAMGIVMTAGADLVFRLTQIPSPVLMSAGASLFPIAVFIAFTAGRVPAWTLGVWLVILGNIGWVLASGWLLVGGAISPSPLGVAFILFQAVAVAAFAALEYEGLQRLMATRLTSSAGLHENSPKV